MTPKKFYQKPQIKEVNLAAEEAVLAGCKNAVTPMVARVSGKRGCNQNNCVTRTS